MGLSHQGGYHQYRVLDFDDETLERFRVSVPEIYSGNHSKSKQNKEDSVYLKNGYRREYSGGYVIYRKGHSVRSGTL